MRRWFKWFVLFGFVTLAFSMVVVLGVFQLIPQGRIRVLAAEVLGHKMNRQMILGPVHLGVTGLRVDELQLSEIPNFDAGSFITAQGIRLGWDLRSLWEGLEVRKKMISKSSGRLHIDDLRNPHYSARNFSLSWSLSGIDRRKDHLSGWARLEQGPGLLQNIDQLIATSPTAKLALTPVTLLMNMDRMGFLNLGLPDLRHWPIQSIVGEYQFKNGVMTIQRFVITSPQLEMETSGTVDLSSGNLALGIELKSPPRMVTGALDVKLRVSGTTGNPKVDLQDLKKKAFKATLFNLLQNKKLFH